MPNGSFLFEEHRPGDLRVRHALDAGRAWLRSDITMADARPFAFAAHAAARESTDPAAVAAARAAGQALGVAHVVGHAPHAAAYAVSAVIAAGGDEVAEMQWQRARCPRRPHPSRSRRPQATPDVGADCPSAIPRTVGRALWDSRGVTSPAPQPEPDPEQAAPSDWASVSDPSAAIARYAVLHPELGPVTTRSVSLIRGILDEAGINYLTVTGLQAKSVESFAAKATGNATANGAHREPLREITDQVGVRVITYVQSDVVAVAELLADEFTVLEDRDMGQETAREGRSATAAAMCSCSGRISSRADARIRFPHNRTRCLRRGGTGILPVAVRLGAAAHGPAARVGRVRTRHSLQGRCRPSTSPT